MTVDFSCLAWSGVDTRGLNYLHNNETVPLRISSAFRSGPYRYTGPNPIVFFRETRAPDGTLVREPVASAHIDPGLKNVLLLFVTAPTAVNTEAPAPAFRVLVLDDDTSVFPMGSYRVFNLSDHEIGGIIDEKAFTIAPNHSFTVTPEAQDEVDVRIHFSSKIDGQWVPSLNTRWLYRKNARRLVFVTRDTSAKRPLLKIKTISQYAESNTVSRQN